MKLNLAKSFVVAAGLTAIAFAAPAKAALVITEVMSSSSHPGGTSNADWFELTNTGGSAFSLTGFSWDDNTETPGSAHFGSISSIAAGASVVITGETVGAEAAFRSDWGIDPSVQLVNLGSTEFQSLSSTSDEVNIYNASNTLVTSVTLGAATTGASFEWNNSGTFLGTAVAGQNGAFTALGNGAGGAGTDVGSPGNLPQVTPEPASLALLGLSGMLFARRRKN